MKPIIVIGAGLAGSAAAVRLADAGKQVLLLEKHPFVGGRTSSWMSKDMHIESGLHRFLGFYTVLPDLLKQVGVSLDDILCWEDEIEIRTIDKQHATLGLAPLHKPLKTAWDMLGHLAFLPLSDRPALGGMFLQALKDYHNDPLGLDGITVAEYARNHNVSEKALQHVLRPLTEGIFFVPPDRYSMHNLTGLFAPYLKAMHKLRVGAFMGGMTEVMMEPIMRYITTHGGMLVRGAPVKRLVHRDDTVVGVEYDGTIVEAEAVILATSLHHAQQLIQTSHLPAASFRDMLTLRSMSAVTFQIELTQPFMDIDRTTFGPQTILASFAEQSRTTFRSSSGRASIILAQPERFIQATPSSILPLVLKDMERLGLRIRREHILDMRKVVWEHDFYDLGTGSEALRPAQRTGIRNLYLAGDYTKQPYLATMEGAVVSGTIAADEALGDR